MHQFINLMYRVEFQRENKCCLSMKRSGWNYLFTGEYLINNIHITTPCEH